MSLDLPTQDDLQDTRIAELENLKNRKSTMEIENSKMSDFWMKIAGLSFTLWSVAVGYAIKSLNDFEHQFGNYVLVTERRVTLLEERQTVLLQKIAEIVNVTNR
jgi:Tfp pilus assembly protein PilN